MMSQTTSPIAPAAQSAHPAQPALPLGVLDNLAARFRPGGLCLMMLNPDGTLTYFDNQSGLFFQRFAVPMVQYSDPSVKLAEKIAAITAQSTVEIWNNLPGVALTAFPY